MDRTGRFIPLLVAAGIALACSAPAGAASRREVYAALADEEGDAKARGRVARLEPGETITMKVVREGAIIEPSTEMPRGDQTLTPP